MALRRAAHAFRQLAGVDVVWLAIRESRSQSAAVHWAEGARSSAGLGHGIEPGVGVGGSVIQTGQPWVGSTVAESSGELSASEQALLGEEGITNVMVIPLRTAGLRDRESRIEGVAYAGSRTGRPFSETTLATALLVGERFARSVRDTQRLSEATRRWERAWTETAEAKGGAEH